MNGGSGNDTLTGGGYVISWTSNGEDDAGSYGVYSQRFDANGIALGGETRANSYSTSTQSTPAVTATADGGFVVSWQSAG